MKEILIPLNFTTTPTVYDTKQSFSTSDEASGVLTFTTTADVAGTVASLTIRNASENANRQTVRIERLDVNTSPFSYALKNSLPFGQYEGTVLLKKNLTVIASASFLFGVNSSLSAEVLPDLVKAYSLDELVENVETEVSNLKDAFNLTVSETVKGVNKTESSLQAQENVRYLNEHQRKANELERIANENARIAAELERKDTFDTLVDSAVIEETVAQEVANEFQQIESTYANRLLSTEQQLADKVNRDEVANGLTAKGASLYANLPTSGNTTGDYYYCSDGNGTDPAGNYVWNGTAWYFGGTGDAGYNELKAALDDAIGYNFIDIKGTLQGLTFIDRRTGVASSGTNYWTTDYVDVADYGELYYTGVIGGSISTNIAFYDASNVYLTYDYGPATTTSEMFTNRIVNIPSNCKYVRATSRDDTVFALSVKERIKVEDRINDTNLLYGKKLAVDGDSICDGYGFAGGYAGIIGANNNMTITNLAASGGTITKGTVYIDTQLDRHWICDSVKSLPNDADYYIVEGGVNDYTNREQFDIGVLTQGYNDVYDENTFCGAMESICQTLTKTFKGKKVGFILVHRCFNDTGWKTLIRPNIISALEKWGIPYLDLETLMPALKYLDIKADYTFNADGTHPNELGYKTFYVPKIEAWLKSL